MPRPPATLRPTGPALGVDWDIVLVMMYHTREALVADSTLHVWQHVVEQILLLNQFLMQNLALLLILLLLKDTAQKLLLLKHYGVALPEKEPSRLSSASTRTLR